MPPASSSPKSPQLGLLSFGPRRRFSFLRGMGSLRAACRPSSGPSCKFSTEVIQHVRIGNLNILFIAHQDTIEVFNQWRLTCWAWSHRPSLVCFSFLPWWSSAFLMLGASYVFVLEEVSWLYSLCKFMRSFVKSSECSGFWTWISSGSGFLDFLRKDIVSGACQRIPSHHGNNYEFYFVVMWSNKGWNPDWIIN